MARKYSESRTYQIGVNEIGDRVRALIIVIAGGCATLFSTYY